jgi:RNA polymerase sigma-70 factor (ECF subfamily)
VAADDAELLSRAKGGDTSAYGQLIERHQDRLYRSVRQILHSPEDTADVCQEAFISAFQSLAKYRGESQFYTWLYRIAFNAAVSFLRSKKPLISVEAIRGEDQNGLEIAGEISSTDPTRPLDRREKAAEVQRALSMLSTEHRLIIVLKDVEDTPYEEIASILEIPVGTVRSRLHRAREELKTILERLEIEP